jgi:hypothetical protein
VYGDTAVLRALARAMREQGEDIRAESAALVSRADAVRWSGLAADALRRLAREQACVLTASAHAHDRAAEALERHAREVDHVKNLIAAVERRVDAVLDSVGADLSGLLHSRVVHWFARTELPPPGHLAWLDLRLPRWLP